MKSPISPSNVPWRQILPPPSFLFLHPFLPHQEGLCRKQGGQAKQRVFEAGSGPGLEEDMSLLSLSNLRAGHWSSCYCPHLRRAQRFFFFLSETSFLLPLSPQASVPLNVPITFFLPCLRKYSLKAGQSGSVHTVEEQVLQDGRLGGTCQGGGEVGARCR